MTGKIRGQELTTILFAQTFRALPGYLGVPCQNVCLPWLSKDIPNFLAAPPFTVYEPHPPGKHPDQKVWVLRGPAAILFISRGTCSDSIAKLFRACFVGYRTIIARYVAKWGIAQICLCETEYQGGVSHHFGRVLTCPKKYRAIWGIAPIAKKYRTIWGHYPLARNQYINNSPRIFSCIRAGADTCAAYICTEINSAKIFLCIGTRDVRIQALYQYRGQGPKCEYIFQKIIPQKYFPVFALMRIQAPHVFAQ